MMSMVSAGISSFKRALASSRVQPLNIRNATRTAAARRIGRLPRVVEARWGFSADPGAAEARPRLGERGDGGGLPGVQAIAGVLMSLVPGGLRELHWHANAAEWAYVIKGQCRVTTINPQGQSQ